jgi:hypothetical protein
MSLGDLVPVALECDFRPMRTATAKERWDKKNRKHLTTYKRKWRAERRAKGLPVT